MLGYVEPELSHLMFIRSDGQLGTVLYRGLWVSLANLVLNWILTDQVLVGVTMETANLGGHFGGGKKSGELKRYRYHLSLAW